MLAVVEGVKELISDDIKKWRKAAHLSQRELAEKSGISFSYLTKLESGVQTNPTLAVINAIKNAVAECGVELVKGGDEK